MYRTDVLVKIGRRIKSIRLEKNMTQNDLAIDCEFEKASLSRIEAGKTNITIRTLFKISKALDVNIVELFAD
jgi:transcriptional regulator with XRE-family HTH domain